MTSTSSSGTGPAVSTGGANSGSTTATWVMSAKFSCSSRKLAAVVHSLAEGRPDSSASHGVLGRLAQSGQAALAEPDPHEAVLLADREGAHPRVVRHLGLGRAPARSCRRRRRRSRSTTRRSGRPRPGPGSAGRPVRVAVLERDRRAVSGAVEHQAGVEGAPAQRAWPDLVTGRGDVPALRGYAGGGARSAGSTGPAPDVRTCTGRRRSSSPRWTRAPRRRGSSRGGRRRRRRPRSRRCRRCPRGTSRGR